MTTVILALTTATSSLIAALAWRQVYKIGSDLIRIQASRRAAEAEILALRTDLVQTQEQLDAAIKDLPPDAVGRHFADWLRRPI